ncbi:MAG: HDOD domain-containing protein [Terriglobia bacterium]
MIEAIMIVKGQESFPHPPCEGFGTSQLDSLRVEADLACLPPALARMNSLLGAAPVDLRSLAEAIKQSPGLAAEAVKFCNSSLFALPQPVASLEQAVLLMDADIVRALLLTSWLVKHTGANIPARDNRLFWSHSLLAAQLSRHVSEWAGYAQPEWAFLAGLFHDIGILPFLAVLPRNGSAKPEGWFEDVGDALEPQRRRFGTDHCELGLQMSSVLSLPLPLAEAAARHHQRGATLSGMPLLSFAGAAEVIAQAVSGRRDAPLLPQGQIVRNALAEFLPGLNPLARAGLVRTLEADLAGTAAQFGEINVWDDSMAGAEAQPRAANGPVT